MIRGYINYLLRIYQFFLINKVACIILLLLVTNILFAIGQTPNYIKNYLISNAIKYYDKNKGNPQISININQVNGATRISINDNGIGIRTEHQNKVFQMFYRASEKSYGSGLGLYIINETIKKIKWKNNP